MGNPWKAAAVTGVVGVFMGTALGYTLAPVSSGTRLPVEPPPAAPVLTALASSTTPQCRDAFFQRRIGELEQMLQNTRLDLRSAEEQLAAAMEQRDGGTEILDEATRKAILAESKPLMFPTNAPQAFSPKGFQKLVERSIKECGLAMDLRAMDCSEYPCIAWLDSTQKRINMYECAPWKEAFGEMTSVVASDPVTMPDGGTMHYVGLMAVPSDPVDRRTAFKRARERSKSMLESFATP